MVHMRARHGGGGRPHIARHADARTATPQEATIAGRREEDRHPGEERAPRSVGDGWRGAFPARGARRRRRHHVRKSTAVLGFTELRQRGDRRRCLEGGGIRTRIFLLFGKSRSKHFARQRHPARGCGPRRRTARCWRTLGWLVGMARWRSPVGSLHRCGRHGACGWRRGRRGITGALMAGGCPNTRPSRYESGERGRHPPLCASTMRTGRTREGAPGADRRAGLSSTGKDSATTSE